MTRPTLLRLEFQVEPHPADWSRGKRAGHDRNQLMVDLGADAVLAFPTRSSRGTYDCAARVERAGITLWWVTSVVPMMDITTRLIEARRRLR